MMLPCGSHFSCATEVDDVETQNSTQLKIAEEKFRFVSQWEMENGNAYRLYEPNQGCGDTRFQVCEIEALKGSSLAPKASCRSIR